MAKIIDMLPFRSQQNTPSDDEEFEKLCAMLKAMQISLEDFLAIEDEDSERFRMLHQRMVARLA